MGRCLLSLTRCLQHTKYSNRVCWKNEQMQNGNIVWHLMKTLLSSSNTMKLPSEWLCWGSNTLTPISVFQQLLLNSPILINYTSPASSFDSINPVSSLQDQMPRYTSQGDNRTFNGIWGKARISLNINMLVVLFFKLKYSRFTITQLHSSHTLVK